MAIVKTESFSSVRVGTVTFMPSGFGKSYSFNFQISGTFVGTVVLERSLDGGTTYIALSDSIGNAIEFSKTTSLVVSEVQPDVLFRARCTAFTSGTIAVRMSC